MIRITSLILFAIFISNCSSTESTTKNTLINVEFTQILQEFQGGYKTEKFLVIKEKNTAQDLYSHINKLRKPGVKTPEINYNKHILLGLFMGEKSSGGYAISVDHIIESSSKITVFVKEITPKGMTTMAITSPFCLVIVAKSEKQVVFEKIQ